MATEIERSQCDLGTPCERCIESSLPCNGPISGLFIVNADPSTYSRLQSTKASKRTQQPASQAESQLVHAPIHNPELAPNFYDEVLLWKFLTYFSQNAGGRVWTARLPSLVAAKNRIAMRTAARAVSLAFAAQNVDNPSMARIARESYGMSLRYHQFSFKAPVGKNICQKKAINALPVTVLLSYYELIHATSADAWLKHTLAAERLFVLLGPESLDDPLLNHLFFIIRANAIVRCVLDGTATQLISGQWSDVRMLAPCGRGTATLHALMGLNSRLWRKLKSQLFAEIDKDVTQLNALWINFAHELGFEIPTRPFVDTLRNCWSEIPSSFDGHVPQVPDFALDGGVALTESCFHAAAILVLTIIHQKNTYALQEQILVDTPDIASSIVNMDMDQSIHHHAGRILNLSDYQRSLKVGCACLRMVLPLTVVSRLGFDLQQCLQAEELFREWCVEDGLPGLAAFSFGDKSALLTMASSV